MVASNDQFTKFSLTGFENALRFAQISLDGTERLFKFNLDSAKQSLEENVQAAKDLAAATDPQDAFNQLNKLASRSIDKAVANSRGVYEILSTTQTELAKLAEENLGTFNKSLISAIETAAKSSPSGSDAALNAVKTSIAAAAAAVNSFSKAAQQVAEFTDSSVKAASSATADAVKTATKRGSTAA
ncbi:MAG TPA: phasin family protein [Chromobacteriaceae bacterium]|nr:phasin family protein [Chromobacteriaceae bacterium]